MNGQRVASAPGKGDKQIHHSWRGLRMEEIWAQLYRPFHNSLRLLEPERGKGSACARSRASRTSMESPEVRSAAESVCERSSVSGYNPVKGVILLRRSL
jgi:hypothetical protein